MSLTSVIRYTRALDSAATDGSGKTGLVFSGITAKYLTQGGTLTSLTTETITTLGTYQAPTDASHIRIKELSSSDPCKGVYEVHFHNTQVVDTGKKLWLFLSASGAAFQPLEADLVIQTGDAYAVVNDSSFGNSKLVRSTTPANTLDVSSTGEAGLDFANIKDATGSHTLTNITVPTVTTLTNLPTAPTDWVSAASVAAGAVTKIQSGLATATSLSTTNTSVTGIKTKTDQLPTQTINRFGVPRNVALSNFLFSMVQSFDHLSPAGSDTLTAVISKDGGSFAACSNAPVFVNHGVYKINLIQAEMNAAQIVLYIEGPSMDPRTVFLVTS